jgi:hypothetical protein
MLSEQGLPHAPTIHDFILSPAGDFMLTPTTFPEVLTLSMSIVFASHSNPLPQAPISHVATPIHDFLLSPARDYTFNDFFVDSPVPQQVITLWCAARPP